MRILARSVDIGIAQRDVVQAVGVAVDEQVVFDCVLAGAVAIQRIDRVRLVDRQELRFAVGRAAGGGIDELLHALAARRFQQIDRTDDIDLGVEGRLAHRSAHVGQGRLVTDDLWLRRPKSARYPLWVADVGLIERRSRVEVGQLAGAEVVQNGHLVACGHIGIDDV